MIIFGFVLSGLMIVCKRVDCNTRHSSNSKGRHKKLFFYFRSKGGVGVSANPKNPYQKILRFF